MSKAIVVALALLACSAGTALAACPTAVPGNTAEAIRANEQRLICLQREVAEAARQRDLEMKIQSLQNAIQKLQLDRRFDQLPNF